MTFTQLEYINAVNIHRHFASAAESCFVTQPTLSMQIQKLEEELGVKIFDRSKQPVIPTEAGLEILAYARKILSEKSNLEELIASQKGIVNGILKLGVIPTLAPYLLPLFVPAFTQKYPQVRLQITELTTETLISQLKEGRIDVGLIVTPLNDASIKEMVLFYEKMVAYVSEKNSVFQKEYILPKDIDPNKLWLLEEGHCFRSQIINLCELKKKSAGHNYFEYEAGSLETLRRMVDMGDGITILPELATIDMTARQQNHLRPFTQPSPVREISIVTHRDFVKKRLVNALRQSILEKVPKQFSAEDPNKKIIPI